MNSDAPIEVEVVDPWDQCPAGEFVPLRLILRRPPDWAGAVSIPQIVHPDQSRVAINSDLFPGDVQLGPGESYALTLGVKFVTAGAANLNQFLVQANPVNAQSASENSLVPLPDRPIRVVPSIVRQVRAEVARICEYDQGVKLEVTLRHHGETTWREFEARVGPAGRVRAGATCLRRTAVEPGWRERFEVVVAGDSVELGLAATDAGERVEERHSLPVPPSDGGPAGFRPFEFLEPRALTTDRITVQPAGGGPEVLPRRGVIPVRGGRKGYVVTIYPSHTQALDVDLLRAPGQAEVEPMKSEGRAWSFLLTIVDNPWLTQTVRLYYDVQVPGEVLRGELHLSVHPSSAKLWTIAATAGAALTIKGVTALVPALLSPEHVWEDLMTGFGALLQKHWTDWLQFLSIPLLRAGLSGLDWCLRPFREA